MIKTNFKGLLLEWFFVLLVFGMVLVCAGCTIKVIQPPTTNQSEMVAVFKVAIEPDSAKPVMPPNLKRVVEEGWGYTVFDYKGDFKTWFSVLVIKGGGLVWLDYVYVNDQHAWWPKEKEKAK